MLSLLKKLLNWTPPKPSPLKLFQGPEDDAELSREEPSIEEIFERLSPPENPLDPDAWDRYWRDQFELGTYKFCDMFVEDRRLIEALRARGGNRVLCIGNGISLEPHALAAAGFAVEALDLSQFATLAASSARPKPEALDQIVGAQRGEGGSVRFITGDLFDPKTCPGPFDAVIERRTVQLYDGERRVQAFEGLLDRLSVNGLFLSHWHNGRWRPPAPRTHGAEGWFEQRGDIEVDKGRKTTPSQGRVAWLQLTTG